MSRHVGVVGGGIIGLCCAYYLARQGHRVTLLDRGAPAEENCSHGNAGLVVPSHIIPMAAPGVAWAGLKWMRDPQSPFYVQPRLSRGLAAWGWRFMRAGTPARVRAAAPVLMRLNMASRAAFEELSDELSDEPSGFDFERRGLLMLFQTQAALDEEGHVAEHARRLGMPAEILDAQQVARRDPGIQMDVRGGVFYPNDCHLSPHKLMAQLRRALEQAGAQLKWGTEVSGWNLEGRRVRGVRTARGEAIEADEWVLCGGSWSPQTARQLKLRLPMQAGKGYSVTLPRPRHRPTLPSLLMEARVAVTPMGHSLRVAGTLELAGLSTAVNPSRVEGILKAMPRYFPEFEAADFEGLEAWAGLRPCSPDGLPFVGRTRRFDNLCVATGHAMMGLSLGPVTGQLIAQAVAGAPSPLSSPLLSPDRYA